MKEDMVYCIVVVTRWRRRGRWLGLGGFIREWE